MKSVFKKSTFLCTVLFCDPLAQISNTNYFVKHEATQNFALVLKCSQIKHFWSDIQRKQELTVPYFSSLGSHLAPRSHLLLTNKSRTKSKISVEIWHVFQLMSLVLHTYFSSILPIFTVALLLRENTIYFYSKSIISVTNFVDFSIFIQILFQYLYK